MQIDHIHFFVDDAIAQRDWLMQRMGWQPAQHNLPVPLPHSQTESLRYGDLVCFISSPLTAASPVATYLDHHAPGIADVAVRVASVAAFLAQADVRVNARAEDNRWAKIQGWGAIQHTLMEPVANASPGQEMASASIKHSASIDHIVLNVPVGELQGAIAFYQELFGLEVQQTFQIQTQQSALHSQVLYSPQSQIYFNINEPASRNSQIQTFLDANRGAGIQHLAIAVNPIIKTVQQLRRRGLPLLSIPRDYYQQLRSRLLDCKMLPVSPSEWQQIQEQQILLDWQPEKPESLLLQIFSKPIFEQPTFFLS